ncbi:MAG: ATP-dependent zinc protease [Spirochaetota bacterium]
MITIGWREWVSLPDLGVTTVKAKVDTGARTSSLHTASVEPFSEAGRQRVRFVLHPLQETTDVELVCEADVVDFRTITNSGGASEERYVIRTPIRIGTQVWPIEVSLANRETMTFRMLLGRTALRDHVLIHAGRSYLTGIRHHHAYDGVESHP